MKLSDIQDPRDGSLGLPPQGFKNFMAPTKNPMNVSFLQELMTTVAEQGRSLLPKGLNWAEEVSDIRTLSEALVSSRGEAAGVAIARKVLEIYQTFNADQKREFFTFICTELQPSETVVTAAADAYLKAPDPASLARLQQAVESPRQEFFRRLNLAPGATREIVGMRRDLLGMLKANPDLKLVDDDLKHLLYSWFNRGFLMLKRIDWSTPAALLEKIIAYEAVHQIDGWDDLRRRLDARDRRCFGFFHPALIDEPLIFVEVALTDEISDAIGPLLTEPAEKINAPTTAVFYSISNCQEGLKGISFGNFLIKQVVEDLARELPTLKTFVTLSPVPGFARWLEGNEGKAVAQSVLNDEEKTAMTLLQRPRWQAKERATKMLEAPMKALAAYYFLAAKSSRGGPVDPVARFHLGNGAMLERVNFLGDLSPKGVSQAHTMMVNYLYNLKEIEKNHEAFANRAVVAASRQVRSFLRTYEAEQAPEASKVPGTALALAEKKAPAQLPKPTEPTS